MTANVLRADRQLCTEAGMSGFVPKPVSPAALRNALKEWILPADGAHAAAGQAPEASESAGQTPVFDQTGLLERLEGDRELAAVIIEAFLDDMPGQIENLKNIVAANDAHTAGRLAHSIKGAAANCGGERLRKAALTMENAADDGDLDAVKSRINELEAQFSLLRDTMQQEGFAEPACVEAGNREQGTEIRAS
jgi:HPt (histidine-containing phosphotransfer) domain-containing protein